MAETKNNNINITEERELSRINKKYSKMTNSGSRSLRISFILLNIMMLVLKYVYLSNKSGVVRIDTILEDFKWQYLLLLILMFIVFTLCYVLPMFFKFNSITKSRNFGLIYKSNVVSRYFGITTLFNRGENVFGTKYLENNGVDSNKAIGLQYDKSLTNKTTNLIYSLMLFILGCIFWSNNINIIFIILCSLYLIYNICYVGLVILFYYRKKQTIVFISKIIKFLYKIGIVKDFEFSYNKVVDRLIIYARTFKQNKILIFINVISGLIGEILIGFVLYYATVILNLADVALIGEILYKCIVLRMVLKLWPLYDGALIYEIAFMKLFSNVFFAGYAYWAMIIFRIFEYFFEIFQYCIVLIIDTIKNKIAINKNKGATE